MWWPRNPCPQQFLPRKTRNRLQRRVRLLSIASMIKPPLIKAAPLRSTLAEIRLMSPEGTAQLAQSLAVRLGAGDVVCLQGDLGAGKTHFARSVIQFLLAEQGLVEGVPSPSFTLVQTYQAGALEIWHSDLYRLCDPQEVDELGLTDAFESALCLIEWPDRLAGDVPDGALWLSFSTVAEDADIRDVRISSAKPGKWRDRIADLVRA